MYPPASIEGHGHGVGHMRFADDQLDAKPRWQATELKFFSGDKAGGASVAGRISCPRTFGSVTNSGRIAAERAIPKGTPVIQRTQFP
jgi:hypothetical protein